MKKGLFLIALILMTTPAFAIEDGRTEQGFLARPLMVVGRGIANVAGFPFEITSTLVREHEAHPRLWPVTYVPRFLTNVILRTTSAVNDIFFLPWVVPFTDDISPWTEPMGLPDYPWQINP